MEKTGRFSRIRKAIGGGVGGAFAAVVAGITFTGAPTQEQVGQLVGSAAGGFFLGFITTWRTPANAPA